MISQKLSGSASGTTERKKDSFKKSLLNLLVVTYIGQLERGEKNATLESVEKIAAAMDVSLSELFEKLGKSGNTNFATRCYDFVAAKSEAEQEQLYKMLLEMDKYKKQ